MIKAVVAPGDLAEAATAQQSRPSIGGWAIGFSGGAGSPLALNRTEDVPVLKLYGMETLRQPIVPVKRLVLHIVSQAINARDAWLRSRFFHNRIVGGEAAWAGTIFFLRSIFIATSHGNVYVFKNRARLDAEHSL